MAHKRVAKRSRRLRESQLFQRKTDLQRHCEWATLPSSTWPRVSVTVTTGYCGQFHASWRWRWSRRLKCGCWTSRSAQAVQIHVGRDVIDVSSCKGLAALLALLALFLVKAGISEKFAARFADFSAVPETVQLMARWWPMASRSSGGPARVAATGTRADARTRRACLRCCASAARCSGCWQRQAVKTLGPCPRGSDGSPSSFFVLPKG